KKEEKKLDDSRPPVDTLLASDGKSLIMGRCGSYRDGKGAANEGKQLKWFTDCMEQDCALSLNDHIGCRYLDGDGFCYNTAKAQKWCLDNKLSTYCQNDGGDEWGWASAKMGTADGDVTGWTPAKDVALYDEKTGKAKYDDSGQEASFSCACLKNCACEWGINLDKSKCRCASGGQEKVVGDQTTAMPRILDPKSSNSKGKCGCICGHKYGKIEAK
ncbi:hypothetical protein T484DRAFT_1777413, partial [Baffinella frigidus]